MAKYMTRIMKDMNTIYRIEKITLQRRHRVPRQTNPRFNNRE